MFPYTTSRVEQHTDPAVNTAIRHEWQHRVAALKDDDRNALINIRLHELDREWDIERALQSNFAAVSLLSIVLASRGAKPWHLLAATAPAFMLLHALQGWCPPLPVLRRLGLRSAREISEERFALKSLRGDFTSIGGHCSVDDVWKAAKK